MRNSKNSLIIALFLMLAASFSAGANLSAQKAKSSKPSAQSQLASPAKSSQTGSVQAQLDKAKKDGNAIFVVVTSAGTKDTPKALALANKAKAKCKNSVVLEMDRDNSANAALVTKWQLTGAPLPLILVVSPKGSAVGGFTMSNAKVDDIVYAVPTPKEDDVYQALADKKPVFVIVGKKANADRPAILANCRAANTQLRAAVVIVEVDPADAKEKRFINMLNASNVAATTNVFVFNSAGQATGTFSGKAETASLIAAASKVIKSGGCCPGGAPSGGCGTK